MMNDYRRIVRRRLLLILLLALLIVASLLLDFMLGPSGLPLQNLWQTLTDPASADPGTRAIVWDIRLPQVLQRQTGGAEHKIEQQRRDNQQRQQEDQQQTATHDTAIIIHHARGPGG
ncbi:hypothetical protein ACTXQV_47600, partial [Klebsiella pneumoniae]